MDPKHRMYSIPFNGMNPEWFLQEVEKRKHHIDHVYCELPYSEREMLSHVRFLFDGKDGVNANKPDANSRRIFISATAIISSASPKAGSGASARLMLYTINLTMKMNFNVLFSLWHNWPEISNWRGWFFPITALQRCFMPWCRSWNCIHPATSTSGICGRCRSGRKSAVSRHSTRPGRSCGRPPNWKRCTTPVSNWNA